MMAYELIFGSIPIISLFIISVLIILVKLKKIIIIRAFAFNFTIFLSTLYYFFFIIKFGFNLYIYLSFLLELIFLMGYIYLFKSFFINFEKHNINYDTVKKRLKNLLYIYIIINIGLSWINIGTIGIFSQTSRIEYLIGNPLNKYITYLSTILSLVIIVYVAKLINIKHTVDRYFIISITVFTLSSILSGSKGANVLLFLSLLSLLKKEIFQKNYRYILFSIIIIISITIIGFAYFSNLDIFFAINFNLARIFLTNDTRALAIDLAYLKGFENGNIFIESLRGLSTKLFGSTPEFPPIGVYLYQYFFNVDSFMGGNASTSALLILFGSSEDKIIFFFLTIIILFILIMLPNIVKGKRFFYYLMSSYCVVLLSQDFLSFQVVFIILVIFIIKDILFIGLINNTKKKNNYV